MPDQRSFFEQHPSLSGDWIAIFGNTFIALDAAGVVREVIGLLDLPPARSSESQGTHWQDVIARAAARDAQSGLRHLWDAIANERVAPEHWPATVPFGPDTVAHLRRIEGNPHIAYAVHILPAALSNLDALLSTHMPDALQYLMQLSQGVFRGVHGPLTDPQVNVIGNIVTLSQTIDHLFTDLRIEISAPTMLAPEPHPLDALFAFEAGEFPAIRRISTHRLELHTDLPNDVRVYCFRTVRDIIRQMLETLFGSIIPRTAITITCPPDAPAATVQVMISYHTREASLYSAEPVHPLRLTDASRFKPTTPLQRLVTTAQSYVRPVNGQVWAESVIGSDHHTMHIGIILPRWQTN